MKTSADLATFQAVMGHWPLKFGSQHVAGEPSIFCPIRSKKVSGPRRPRDIATSLHLHSMLT